MKDFSFCLSPHTLLSHTASQQRAAAKTRAEWNRGVTLPLGRSSASQSPSSPCSTVRASSPLRCRRQTPFRSFFFFSRSSPQARSSLWRAAACPCRTNNRIALSTGLSVAGADAAAPEQNADTRQVFRLSHQQSYHRKSLSFLADAHSCRQRLK